MKQAKPRQVWWPAEYRKADVLAIQSLAAGKASESEQKRALDWIIVQAAQTYDNGFVADDANGRTGAFVQGRQSVGQQIVKLMKLNLDVVTE